MNNANKTFTTGQAAKFCGVNFRTVIRWIQQGKLEAYSLPGRGDKRILQSNLIAFLKCNDMPVPMELQSHTKRILIVDDDKDMASAITRLLKLNGYVTETANNGFAAGALLHSFNPSIMLLDLKMPGIDGFEVLDFSKNDEKLKNIAVIVISAESEQKLAKAIAHGAEKVLAKPFHNKQLLDLIQQLEAENLSI